MQRLGAYIPLVFFLGCGQQQQQSQAQNNNDPVEMSVSYWSTAIDQSLRELQRQADDSISAGYERCFNLNLPGKGIRPLRWGVGAYRRLEREGVLGVDKDELVVLSSLLDDCLQRLPRT